jgi:hypothetical protein
MPGPSVTVIRSYVFASSIALDGALGERWSIGGNRHREERTDAATRESQARYVP